MRWKLVAGTAVLAAAALVPAAAGAAPKPDPNLSITLNCPGTALDGPVVTAGGGNSTWTPAFRGSKVVLVPVAFGAFTGTATGPDGSFPINDPPIAQGANKGGNHPLISCTYHIVGTDGPFSFVGDGSVSAFVVGKP